MLKSLSYFIVILVTVIFFLFLISPVDPVKWSPSNNPGFNGPLAINNILSKVEKIKLPFGVGPEDIAVDSNGYKYTGLRDGTITRFKDDLDFEIFANTGGKPLGMEFDENGIFWVAFAGIRSPLVDGLSNFPTIRKILGGLPKILLSPINKHVFILGLDVEGNVIFNLHDKESDIKVLTSANFFGNKLYIGNLASNFIATIDLKNLEIKNIN